MKVQEVILKAMAGSLKWWEAAEIIGVSDRTMRRWRERYQEHGYDGLYDRRRSGPAPSECRWRKRNRSCSCIGRSISISTCGISMKSCKRSTDPDQLHMGEAGTAKGGSGGEAQSTGATSAAGTEAVTRDAAAHRCQQARLAAAGASLGSDHYSG